MTEDWNAPAAAELHDFDCWQRRLEWRSDATNERVRRAMAPAAGAFLDTVRPWELFWTQTWRPRLQTFYAYDHWSLDYCKSRLQRLLDRAAREVVGMPRGEVRRGRVHGWTSWELHKSGAWHAHLLVIGLGREHWRGIKELAWHSDGMARVYPVLDEDARRCEALYVAKYVAKGPETFDVFGNWRTDFDDWNAGRQARAFPAADRADARESRPLSP